MYRLLTFIVLLTGLLFFRPTLSVAAEDESAPVTQLIDVLRWTYENNPTLHAARAELKAVQEEVPQALGGWRPNIEASGNISSVDIDDDPNTGAADGTTSKEVELAFSQPLFRGGRTVAAVDGAEDKVMAQRALLTSLEQDVLLAVATSYMDVVRDRALLELSTNNESVIAKNLEAAQDRFEVGELTRTDVAQSEARLARAKAERIRASGDLQSSRAAYQEVVGKPPENLVRPDLKFPIPKTRDETIAYAENNSPDVIAARYIHESAEENVDEIFGELLPQLALFGSWNREFDPQPGLLDESTTKTVGVSATIPLYQAGAVRSRVRQAKHTANRRYLEILESRRDVRKQVVTNWENLQAAQAETESREAQVEAARLAQEGVKEENILGARSILDALDADQEYLDAQVALVSAQRNVVVAEFALAATLGLLTPENLGSADFSGEFEEHLETIKRKILGIDVDYQGESL